MEPNMSSSHSRYWATYYKKATGPVVPSQFAVFVYGEVGEIASCLIDVGCGSGRDSFFFASQGILTIGVDSSREAISLCTGHPAHDGVNPTFVTASVVRPEPAAEVVKAIAAAHGSGPLVVYARFFLHAITEREENGFLDSIPKLLGERPGIVALEFRTTRDRHLEKVTPTHFRRYVDPLTFLSKAERRGLQPSYFVEGFGYAKFRGDDAYVARCILDA
jgi:hypothetical protein